MLIFTKRRKYDRIFFAINVSFVKRLRLYGASWLNNIDTICSSVWSVNFHCNVERKSSKIFVVCDEQTLCNINKCIPGCAVNKHSVKCSRTQTLKGSRKQVKSIAQSTDQYESSNRRYKTNALITKVLLEPQQ